jgi:hypothetical protein
MSKYRLDFKEPSWDWDETTPCQYYPSQEDAEIAMRRAVEVEEQRFRHFRICEAKTPGDWVFVEEFNFDHPKNSN